MDVRIHKHVSIRLDCTVNDVYLIETALAHYRDRLGVTSTDASQLSKMLERLVKTREEHGL